MLSRGDVRVCIAYSEMDDKRENSVKDEMKRRESIALGLVHLSRSLRMFKHMETLRSSFVVAWVAAHIPLLASHCGRQ